MTIASSATLTILGSAVVVLALLAVAEGLILIEMIKQVAQIRQRVDLDDEPEPLSLGANASRPFARPDLLPGHVPYAVALLLSSECASCRAVAAAAGVLTQGAESSSVVAILEGRDESDIQQFLTDTALPAGSAIADLGHEIGRATGIRLRPAAVVIREGLMVEAAAVRTSRQLVHLLDRLRTQEMEGGDGAVSAALETAELSINQA